MVWGGLVGVPPLYQELRVLGHLQQLLLLRARTRQVRPQQLAERRLRD